MVEENIVSNAKCYRHCDEAISFRELAEQEDRLVGAYVCSGNYVSRVVYFSPKMDLDLEWFKKTLAANIPGAMIRNKEIRVATRHPWENAVKAEEFAKQNNSPLTPFITRQVYWTPPKAASGEDAQGPFVCSNCKKFFMQSVREGLKTCPDCRQRGF
ncbi:MAG: hypothetical protein HY619_07085 [Thaumarchaeota archaeon]|nr:hypothetical protein [Nitrososphaerota archaeon]